MKEELNKDICFYMFLVTAYMKSLKQFQQIAQHELINLATTEKSRLKFSHENLASQTWAICNATEDISFETIPFRKMIKDQEVTPEQILEIKTAQDYILAAYKSYNLEDKKETRIAKRFITRTHTVMLTLAAKIAIEKGCTESSFIEWTKMFFAGTSKSSIDEVYNDASGSGSAKLDSIKKRKERIINHMLKNINFFDNNVESISVESEPILSEEKEEKIIIESDYESNELNEID